MCVLYVFVCVCVALVRKVEEVGKRVIRAGIDASSWHFLNSFESVFVCRDLIGCSCPVLIPA